MMPPIQHSTTHFALLVVCFVLMGVGCSDSDDDEGLIEEEAEPLDVTIIDRSPFPTKRPDAEILADKILEQETEDFYFDIPRRNQLVGEIERVLSLIRATYPPMNAIDAEEEVEPGILAVYLEPDFYETVKKMIQDKQGPFRFETGNAEFDALNAKLRVREVRLGDSISKNLIFYFDKHLNLNVASEAYSMVEGVRLASGRGKVGEGADIKAFQQGQTWYVIFRNAWGDCPAGCVYWEFFRFAVTGTAVERIPTAQAQTMPPFQELSETDRGWSLHDRTPFFSSQAHTWSWGDALLSGGPLDAFDGFAGGCSLLGEIEETAPNQLRVSCGYRVPEPVSQEDGLIDDYEFAGAVLLLIATQERMLIGNEENRSNVVASEVVRVAKTAAEIQNPASVYFENVTMSINPPPLSAPFERWWGAVHPTFIVCWDHPETGQRAYQFLTPHIMRQDAYEARNQPGCDNFKNIVYLQTLDVYLPDDFIRFRELSLYGIRVIPDNPYLWIDEVLPLPPAPEVED